MSNNTEESRVRRVTMEKGYDYDTLFPLVKATLEAGISVLVLGAPGIGKSTMAQALAASMGKKLIDIRLAQKDPAELGGIYFPNQSSHTLDLFPPDWVKTACEEPCFIFLDEINAAVTKLHQAAAYQIVLEKRIGNFTFHKDTVVLAAGNREDDNAIVTPLSSALCNRFAHYEMRADVQSWLNWAAEHGIAESVMSFIQAQGEEVLFQAGDTNAFPTPRSWEMASRVMAKVEPSDYRQVIAACIGMPMADRFCQYMEIYCKVHAAAILAGKEKLDFEKQEDPSFIYAASFAVSAYVCHAEIPDSQLPNLLGFLTSPGLGAEYQMLFLRQLYHRAQPLFNRLKALEGFRKLANKLVALRAATYL